ncbi:ferritin [Thermospira aquatica]|nr:ferritin [Thermospira aquatica]
MLDKEMNDKLNTQIQEELYSAYLYLAMAAWCDEESWTGSAHWFRKQAQEEINHAMKFYHYIVEKGGRAIMEAIEKPPVEWKDLLAVFEAAYEHELTVTKRIHDLVAYAREVNDYATEQMLQWFVAEQVEEEAQTFEIVQKLKKIGESNSGKLYLDGKLGKRE